MYDKERKKKILEEIREAEKIKDLATEIYRLIKIIVLDYVNELHTESEPFPLIKLGIPLRTNSPVYSSIELIPGILVSTRKALEDLEYLVVTLRKLVCYRGSLKSSDSKAEVLPNKAVCYELTNLAEFVQYGNDIIRAVDKEKKRRKEKSNGKTRIN